MSEPGVGPQSQMGPGMEQGFSPGLRHRPLRRPTLLLRPLHKQYLYVSLCGRVVRHHRDRPPVYDGRLAPLEHVAAAQDGEADVPRGRRRREPAARRQRQHGGPPVLEGEKGLLLRPVRHPPSTPGESFTHHCHPYHHYHHYHHHYHHRPHFF